MNISHVLNESANLIIPLFILGVLCVGYGRKLNVFDTFIEGAKEGIEISLKIMPYLIAIFVAIGLMNGSGLMGFVIGLLKPVTSLIGFPSEVLPLVLIKPLSGSGYTIVLADIMREYGTDSFTGRFASILAGSTETIFYVLTVYFGVVGIKNMKHAFISAVTTEILAVFIAFAVARIMY